MMADKKQKLNAARRRRLDHLMRELSRVERQIACLKYQADQAERFDPLVQRQVVLFAEYRSHQMH
jgi:hypothetical protein